MARSTYTRSLTVTAVTTADPRIRLVLSNTTIPPNKRVFLGMLEFDAGADGKGMQLGFEEFNLNSAINAAVNGQLSKADQQVRRSCSNLDCSVREEQTGGRASERRVTAKRTRTCVVKLRLEWLPLLWISRQPPACSWNHGERAEAVAMGSPPGSVLVSRTC